MAGRSVLLDDADERLERLQARQNPCTRGHTEVPIRLLRYPRSMFDRTGRQIWRS